ncbi:AAA family ATPase [Pelotalea chapellei]|uniref:AAA family ATPase n=1 Tax=Pelotalea chapellei TaxID=44671 RepID=A0ABS5U959_9BACT|nr:AAA family ATPase [Pelotalea chapellei]MBT1072204.1 AAA family ATPase [Pelotalea chapellei]
MKVLRLSFKNLNSLAGVWNIDFKHPDFVSSGIFAITGPTGAGKTTILDAICLALYGQTPRLGRITQSDNEIMSRQTGECYAEVEFETARGRYRCHWSQHRSRKAADGQLQSPRHEIAEAESGLILESKLRAVADKVEEVTGMDFDRFTRSMLLAQGGFAAFLQARPDERAPILEQITGTAIYSRISIKVHERTAQERNRLAELRAELEGIQLVSPAEAEALALEESELHLAETKLKAAAREINEAQSWLERIAILEAELLQLDQDRISFQARKAAAAPELERLELAGRALKLGGEHAHIHVLRTQQEKEQAELAKATQRLPQLQLDWQAAFEALEQGESRLAIARKEQAEQGELIRAARELDVRLGEVQARLQGLSDDIEKTGRQNSIYRSTLAESDQRMSTIAGELQKVGAFLDDHQADAGLTGALAGIEQRLKFLKSIDSQDRHVKTRLVLQANVVEGALLTLTQAEAAWLAAQQRMSEAEERLVGQRAARNLLLQGRDLSAWRGEAERLATRQNSLGAMQEAVARIKEVAHKLTGLKQRRGELEQQRLVLTQQEVSLVGECELREQIVLKLQDNVILLNRVRDLEEDRKQLVDGAPCPLCGSAEHPYAVGNIPRLDQAGKELELALAEARKVREQHARIQLELAGVVKDLQQAGQDRAELEGRQLGDGDFCSNAAAELGMILEVGSNPEAWLQVILKAHETCQVELVTRRAVICEAEQKEREERSAQSTLDTLKDELAKHDQARLAARLGHESALSEHARLKGESAALQANLVEVLSEVAGEVAAYGWNDVAPDAIEKLLTDLTGRRDAYVQQVQARERLEKNRAEYSFEMEKQQALLAESVKLLEEAERQLRDKSAQRDELVEQRLELYGERNPDAEEKRLAEALRQAGEQREGALQEYNRLQGELERLKQQIKRVTDAIAERGDQLSRLEEDLYLRLNESGFADETDFLQACVPQEQFDAFTRMADQLHRDETALQTRHEDRRLALAAELTRNLTDMPLATVREENAAVTGQLSELQKALGAVHQKLQQHAEQQRRHQARLQEIEIQKRECDRWERLHSLIGSSDGKKFRNFAQGLTFELMVAHANRQLLKMSDRYILVRDRSEPLELNVIDNYQAGEIRSTKNLSGGESFIASLALSLGLSSMASRNVRVDSLFLDEGFGTLDEEALETALETLSGLQQDGKLIGIISHVHALKERIGTQIQVEAGSAGRSSLSGPGCRQVV